MSEEELEEIESIFKDIEKCQHAFDDINYCVERTEWEVIKQEEKEHREEFKKIYSKAYQVKSLMKIEKDALNRGDIALSEFEKKHAGLIGEITKLDFDLDGIKQKLCMLIDKIYDFIKKSGIGEEKKEVISRLNDAKNLLLSKKEWRGLRKINGGEKKRNGTQEIKEEAKGKNKGDDSEKKDIQVERKDNETLKIHNLKIHKFLSFTKVWDILSIKKAKKVIKVSAFFGVLLILIVFGRDIFFTPKVPVVEDFSADVRSGPSPLEHVHFESITTGSPKIYTWIFEPPGKDYMSHQPKTAHHSFRKPGIYDVSLTIENDVGISKLAKIKYINVSSNENVSTVIVIQSAPTVEVPIVRDFSANVREGPYPLYNVQFVSKVTGNPTNYYWVFEPPNKDLNASSANTAVHSFHEPGIYDVSLTVENNAGNSTLIKKNYIKVTTSK